MKTIRFFAFVLFCALVACASVSAAPKKAKMAKAKPATDKPDVTQIEPRGIQCGTEVKIKLIGTNLADLVKLKISNPKLKGELLPNEEKNTETWIKLTAAADLPR